MLPSENPVSSVPISAETTPGPIQIALLTVVSAAVVLFTTVFTFGILRYPVLNAFKAIRRKTRVSSTNAADD